MTGVDRPAASERTAPAVRRRRRRDKPVVLLHHRRVHVAHLGSLPRQLPLSVAGWEDLPLRNDRVGGERLRGQETKTLAFLHLLLPLLPFLLEALLFRLGQLFLGLFLLLLFLFYGLLLLLFLLLFLLLPLLYELFGSLPVPLGVLLFLFFGGDSAQIAPAGILLLSLFLLLRLWLFRKLMRRGHITLHIRLLLNFQLVLLSLQLGDFFEVLLDADLADVGGAELGEVLVLVDLAMPLQVPGWREQLGHFAMMILLVVPSSSAAVVTTMVMVVLVD